MRSEELFENKLSYFARHCNVLAICGAYDFLRGVKASTPSRYGTIVSIVLFLTNFIVSRTHETVLVINLFVPFKKPIPASLRRHTALILNRLFTEFFAYIKYHEY